MTFSHGLSADVDRLMDTIEQFGWMAMVTEYPGDEPALAFVGDPETDVAFEAEGPHALEALNRAFYKMRTSTHEGVKPGVIEG